MSVVKNIAFFLRSTSQRIDLRILAAFFVIYVVWGTTYLAIRIAVKDIAPFFAAGLRFFIAGSILYGFKRFRGTPAPSLRVWRNITAIGILMFVAVYAPLFWAEKFVPSGFASLIEASLPVITLTIEMLILRQQPFRWRLLGAAAVGFLGVIVLLLPGPTVQAPLLPCLAIFGGCIAWSLGSVLSKTLFLPESKALTAGAAMMAGGVLLLMLSLFAREKMSLDQVSARGLVSLVYLISFGSLLGYTAFVWLLGRMPASRVASHAYVNPIVALGLGSLFAGERITTRMLIGTVIILLSVSLILRNQNSSPSTADLAVADRV